MKTRENINSILDQINEYGLEFILTLTSSMVKVEEYSINTTVERLAELKEIEAKEREKKKREEELKRVEELEKKNRKREEKLSMYSGFIKNINETKPNSYSMTVDEYEVIYIKNNGVLFDISYDSFKAGFMRGQRAEKKRQRLVKKL